MSLSVVARSLQEPYLCQLAVSILGTDEPEAIVNLVNSMVPSGLGLQSLFLCELSAGAVFGLNTNQGQMLLKVHGPECDVAAADARSRFQGWLARHGYPAPFVVLEPSDYDGRVFSIESYLDTGRRADGHDLDDIRLMAKALAKLVTLGESYEAAAAIPSEVLLPSDYAPWPVPHNSLFDFEATRSGAEQIDAAGRAAFEVLEASHEPLLIGHLDWGAKHCRISNKTVSAVYDWDSVGRFTENRILGAALFNFAASWYVEGPNEPSLAEMGVFLESYVAARESTLGAGEVIAAVRYGAAYGARCEHAIQSDHQGLRELLVQVGTDELEAMVNGVLAP